MIDACIDADMSSLGLLMIDGEGDGYEKIQIPPTWDIVTSGEHLEFCGMLRWAFALCPGESFYGLLTDDDVPRTRFFDKILEEAAGAWHMAGAHNLHNCPPRFGVGVFGGELIRAIGWWAPPDLIHLYIDDFWEYIGGFLGLIKFPPGVVIEHMHFSNGKAPFDQTYERVYKGESYTEKDRMTYETWRAHEAFPTVKRIQEAMNAVGN